MEEETPPIPNAEHPSPEKWYTPLTRVTPLSKAFAMGLFILLPFVGFWWGYHYCGSIVAPEVVIVMSPELKQGNTSISYSDFHYIPGADPDRSEDLHDGYSVRIYGGKLVRYKWGKNEYEQSSVTELTVLAGYEVATSSWGLGEFTYDKGRVLDFWVSPDKSHIAYLVQESLGGCCGTYQTGQAGSVDMLLVTESGGGKTFVIERTPGSKRPDIEFSGWLYDSERFVFYERHFDESTSGSGFYVGRVGTSTVTVFTPLTPVDEVNNDHTQTIAGVAPHFSPFDDHMVYVPDGIDGNTVVLSKTDGSDSRILLGKRPTYPLEVSWHSKGEEMVISSGNERYRFSKDGRPVDR